MITAREIVNATQLRLGLEGSAVVGPAEKMLQELVNLAKDELTLDVVSGKSTIAPAKQLLLKRAISSSTTEYGKDKIFYGTAFNGALLNPDRDQTSKTFPSDKYAYLVPTPTDFLYSINYMLHTTEGGVQLDNTPYQMLYDLNEYRDKIHNHFGKPNSSWAWIYEQPAHLAAGPSISDKSTTPATDYNINAYRDSPFEGVTMQQVLDKIALGEDLNYANFTPQEVQTGRIILQLILGKDVSPTGVTMFYYKKSNDVRFNIRLASTPGGEQGLDWDKQLLPDLVDYVANRYAATRNTQTESYQVQNKEKNE